jgi:hypothetical protein
MQKRRHNTTSKSRPGTSMYMSEKHLSTFHGLNHWYKHVFEELGWIVLAKHHGCMDKVYAYKASLQHLKYALECRIKTMHDVDKKQDLNTMCNDVICLMDHVHQDF